MLKKKVVSFVFLIAMILSNDLSYAAISPLSFGISPLLQFPTKSFTIVGTRLNLLWGEQENVYGLDLGVIGTLTEKSFVGVGLAGLFNSAGKTTILGLQATFGVNFTKEKSTVIGAQIAGLFNRTSGDGRVAGIQMALIGNFTPKMNVYGLQLGGYNQADHVVGVQVGLINSAKWLHGLQIGLINFNGSGLLPIFPFLNIGF